MGNIRDDVRGGFERQQAGLGDVRDARHRLMRDAIAAGELPSHRLQWAAGIAAVLIAAIVVTTFALVRGTFRPQTVPSTSPRASASPTPLQNDLSVPDSTPVILYHDPAKPDQTDAMTWDGKQRGTLHVPPGLPNASATLFMTPTEIRDRTGRLVATGAFGPSKGSPGTWSDDGRHICLMTPFDVVGANGVPATLELIEIGHGSRRVAQVGKIYEQVITYVAACSVASDRAVVVQTFGNSATVAQYWVIQMSTGKTIWTHRFVVSQAMSVVASSDGLYVAEEASDSTILDATGSVAGHASGSVVLFCLDDTQVVTRFSNIVPAIVSWHSGSTVWSSAVGSFLDRVQADPDGNNFALWITTPDRVSQGADHALDLYVIAPDGQVIATVPGTSSVWSLAGS
jgi:hypothetical protein